MSQVFGKPLLSLLAILLILIQFIIFVLPFYASVNQIERNLLGMEQTADIEMQLLTLLEQPSSQNMPIYALISTDHPSLDKELSDKMVQMYGKKTGFRIQVNGKTIENVGETTDIHGTYKIPVINPQGKETIMEITIG